PGDDVEPLAHVEDRHAATDHRRAHRQLRVHGETAKGGRLGSLRAPEPQVTTVEVVNHQAPHTDRMIEVSLPRDLHGLCDEEVQFLVGELPILVTCDNAELRHHSLPWIHLVQVVAQRRERWLASWRASWSPRVGHVNVSSLLNRLNP